jgi:hypothetical protein
MSANSNFTQIFAELKDLLQPYAATALVNADGEAGYSLDMPVNDEMAARLVQAGAKPGAKQIFFGSVQIKKNYVSYHLMPVYIFPDLLKDMSPELKKRMQGKSCFNFKSSDPALFAELAELTKRCVERLNRRTV